MFEAIGNFEGYSSFDVLFSTPQNQTRTHPDRPAIPPEDYYAQHQQSLDYYTQDLEERLNRITREKAILQRQLSDIQYNVETRRTGFPYMWGGGNPPWLISVTGDFSCPHTRCAFRTRNSQFLEEHKASGRHFHLDVVFFASSRPVSEEPIPDESEMEQVGGLQGSSAQSNGPAVELPLRSMFSPGQGETQTDFPWPASMSAPSPTPKTSNPNYGNRDPLRNNDESEEPVPIDDDSSNEPAQNRQTREDKRFRCTRCQKSFARSSTLREHVRMHTSDRPFECSICSKQFARVKDRNRHQALHADDKKFKCRGFVERGLQGRNGEWGCGRGFAREDGLLAHLRSEGGRNCTLPLLQEWIEIGSEEARDHNGYHCSRFCTRLTARLSFDGGPSGCAKHFATKAALQSHLIADGGRNCVGVQWRDECAIRTARLWRESKESRIAEGDTQGAVT